MPNRFFCWPALKPLANFSALAILAISSPVAAAEQQADDARAGVVAKSKMMSTYGARVIGARTRGGAAPFGKIYRVTTLADDGPGSLRYAVRRHGPRIVVFEVAGVIQLENDLRVYNPWITIAGQTAPSPGITLSGATVRIRTSNVVLQHVAVRPGPSADERVNRIRDAISISMCSRCKVPPHNILIDQVSASWSTDEVIGLFGGEMRAITIRNSIVAEALRRAGHPKGAHSAGMLIGSGVLGVEVVGNLFANNGFRNPAVNAGASAVIVNNYIYNPHNLAVHVNAGPKSSRPTRVAMIGNVLDAGPDTREDVATIALARKMLERTPDAVVFSARNRNGVVGGSTLSKPSNFRPRGRPALLPANWELVPSDLLVERILRDAGSRPGDRDATDTRIINGVKERSGRIVDAPPEVVETSNDAPLQSELTIPRFPFSQSGIPGMLRVEAWLCLSHFEVGGPPNRQCNQTSASLRDALVTTGLLPRQ